MKKVFVVITLGFLVFITGLGFAKPTKEQKVRTNKTIDKMIVRLECGKIISLPVPKLKGYPSQPKLPDHFIATKDYKTFADWNGLKLEIKLATEKTDLSTELGEKNLAITEKTFPWGKVASACAPSSGGGCVYLLSFKSQAKTLILRYQASAYLEFDFKNLNVTS